MRNKIMSFRPLAACTLLLASLSLAACTVGSVAPIVGEQDRTFDGRLVGTWKGQDLEGTVVVTARDSDYLIVVSDRNGKTGRFHGQMGRLAGWDVLDITPDDSGLVGNDTYKGMFLPLHTFLIVDSIGAEFRASALSQDSMSAYLKRQPKAIAHTGLSSDEFVLTAPTSELRAFVERYAKRPGVLQHLAWTRQ